eukprot:1158938-Pelagomonas_calceolata.AAC.2
MLSDEECHRVQDEEESAGDRTGGGGMVEPYRVLGEASIILRDPSAMHLLAAAVLQARQGCTG